MNAVRASDGTELIAQEFGEYGLSGLEHTPEVGSTQAALCAAAGLPHDVCHLPCSSSRQWEQPLEG